MTSGNCAILYNNSLPMIGIIDYGSGNIQSVAGAIEKLGFTAVITHDIKQLEAADKLILPGIGAFADCMNKIKQLGLAEPLTQLVLQKKKPILGICVGLQVMAKEGFEFGHHHGLGWIDASVIKLEPGNLPLPHVGWNSVQQMNKGILFENIPTEALFYFTHSYHLQPRSEKSIAGNCHYGIPFTAAVQQGNIYGTQFHPEKSQQFGLKLLQNFLERG